MQTIQECHQRHYSHYTGPGGQLITAKPLVRDLQVLMTDTLIFTDHINQTCSDVKKYCGIILRTFKSREPMLMKTLWTAIIQPRIDYCCQLWFPHKAGDIQKLESLQRSYTGKIVSISHLCPWERQQYLKLASIERRYERYMIIYTWKILEDLVPNTGITAFTTLRRGRLCNIPKINTGASCAIQSIRENSFNIKGPRLFNITPPDVRNLTVCTVDTFKCHLDQFLTTIQDHPRLHGYTGQCQTETNSIIHMKNISLGQHS